VTRLIVIAVLTICSSACSRTEFAYRNADWLLEYYAWQAVDTTAAQRADWQPVLQNTLLLHREQELPLLIAYLDLAADVARSRQGSPGAACLVDGALLLYQRHAHLAADLATPLLAELDAAQIKHLAEYSARRQQDAVERYLDPDPQRRALSRQERITERIEDWTGKLHSNQRQLIDDALARIPDLSVAWLSYRAQQTDKLLVMLETGTDQQTLHNYLDDWWVRREGTSAETRQRWELARRAFIQLMDALAATLTDAQLTKIEKRLGKLRADLAPFLSGPQQAVELQRVPACAAARA
jgi:hypothetical protein